MFKRIAQRLKGGDSNQSGSAGTGSARVLVVDDHPVNLRLSTYLLDSVGFTVESAESGEDAVEAASRTNYDIILMDCMMPEIDGFEATKRIRASEGGDRVTIIGLTADA